MSLSCLLVSSYANLPLTTQAKPEERRALPLSLVPCGHCSRRAAAYSCAPTVCARDVNRRWLAPIRPPPSLPSSPKSSRTATTATRDVKPEAKRLCFLPSTILSFGKHRRAKRRRMLATHALRSSLPDVLLLPFFFFLRLSAVL
jgi:hypothetical protein